VSDAGPDLRFGESSTLGSGWREHAWLTFVAVAGLTGAALILWAGREATFFHDDWWYICGRALDDPSSWLKPHFGHLVVLHVVAFRVLVEGSGLGSYLPFHIALVASHLAVVAGIYALVDKHAGRWPALGAAAVMLVLGSGYYNLFWAFQMGFVASMALGLWALVALPNRPGLAATLLLLAVMFQGVGLFYVAAAGAYLVVLGRIRSTMWLAIPVAVFALWALLYWVPLDSARPTSPVNIGRFATAAIIASIAGGLGTAALPLIGGGVKGALAAVAATVVSRPTAWRSPLVVACAIGIIVAFIVGGLLRPGYQPDQSRYVYLGASFVLPLAATLFGSARYKWVGVVVFVVAFTLNLSLLVSHGATWKAETDRLRAAGYDDVPANVCIPGADPRTSSRVTIQEHEFPPS
jgi:hypothetical protein